MKYTNIVAKIIKKYLLLQFGQQYSYLLIDNKSFYSV